MLINKSLAASASLLALCCLSACAPALRVTLLPQPDGKPSAVVVQSEKNGREAVLDAPYAQSKLSSTGQLQRAHTDAAAVAKDYAQLIALKPAAATHYRLFFTSGTTDLTAESQAQLPAIVQQAKAREGGEIVITGYTDRVGDAAANDQLSLERAQSLREVLVAEGFPAARIRAVGRGERDPIKPTADQVPEPENRRVEILVR